ncbi:hypothetical protein PK98_11150 [Croceibacterium mercuriale]|uniref:Gene transfer agent protein n=1 Tax=Croceibacterium mercuriale TaxID=1572751 RepID=A0A0B2BSY1_9SPHN|nr:DUF3168 domain-containing protein [Croceibacterium mercuriale]KHL24544.1 hypothetical protein PK98_11150 [Croceibacterium mercuriale]
MESLLRIALIDWLRADAVLAPAVNIVAEEHPVQASVPWIGVTASASTDWSTKTERGREVRLTLEYLTRGDDPAEAAAIVAAIEACVEGLPRRQPGFHVAGIAFLRARAAQRARHGRAVLLEYRFRILATA